MDEIAQKVFRFEGFSLDVTRRILRCGDHDVDLRPRSFDVLCCLVANAGKIVCKEEIIEVVWPDVVVTDESLRRCVSDVRLALGDAEQRVIKTVPRHGYLFAAPLSQVSANESSHGAEHLFWRKYADVTRPERPSIAILPFANIVSDQQDYFNDGISGDLTTSLSRFGGLLVIARDSAFKYKGQRIDPKQVGRELGVRYLLQGDIRSDADRLRLTARLVETAGGEEVWAEHYDRERASVFAVQDEVIQRIVLALTTHITKSEFDRALRKRPQVLAAYDCYLRGNALLRTTLGDPTPTVVAEARAYYEQALMADPHYASAMQALANTHIVSWADPNFPEYHQRAIIDRAQALAQQAVDIDPTLAEAHATLGWILRFRRDSEAFAVFERAFAVNPNFVDPRFAIMLAHGGRPAEAIDYMKRIMCLDPLHPHTYIYLLGKGHFFLGQYGQAIELIRTASVRMPAHRRSRILLASVAAHLGCHDEARAAAAEVLRMHPGFTIAEFVSHMMLARQEDAERLAQGLRKAGLPE